MGQKKDDAADVSIPHQSGFMWICVAGVATLHKVNIHEVLWVFPSCTAWKQKNDGAASISVLHRMDADE